MNKVKVCLLLILILYSCEKTKNSSEIETVSEQLFTLVSPETTNVDFKNILFETNELNFLNYSYMYNGGGVAVSDINNDGLQDLYFSSNQGSNKLYLNKGNFEFEDITTRAGVNDYEGWSNGISTIDINNDGFLDFYVCKSASLNSHELRRNKLYVNQGNNTFKEEAKKYGLDHPGFSTQSYFFDYDKDGDLDMYLINHREDFENTTRISQKIQNSIYDVNTDQLFRNDGGVFTKVTLESRIINKAWGLSASIGDFNNDDWPDIYVANDFLEPDFLYINNKDGTFTNEALDRFNHITFYSMGSDYADINNDMYPDLLVLDMMASDHIRSKENMATMSTENFNTMVKRGYHYQYMSNSLQLNHGNGNFSDVAQLSGLAKTDWSWSPLIADFDNDGFKDVFITNGIEKDLGNQDFRKKLSKLRQKKGKPLKLDTLINMIPGTKIPNYIFKNNGDLTFNDKTEDWGLKKKVNSNGAAYADLDNDGDLDLVINNQNEIASIYRNNTIKKSINVKLKGSKSNTLAIGAKVILTTDQGKQYLEVFLNRGFMSSVSNVLNFGIDQMTVEKLEVIWPDGRVSIKKDFNSNELIELSYSDSNIENIDVKKEEQQFLEFINPSDLGIIYEHKENNFDDYKKQLLLPQKQSTLGPCVAVADVNNDGLDDIFFGGAHQQPGELLIQNVNGKFGNVNLDLFKTDAKYEDVGAHFFDVDADGDMDLYVASGGYEFIEGSENYQDRLYVNNGKGEFVKSNKLPNINSSTKAVKSFDYDNDGDLDLIVGGRVVPGKYPLAPKSYILENNDGKFKDVTNIIASNFESVGMVSDIEIVDIDADGRDDIIAVGPWMPVTVLSYNGLEFVKKDLDSFKGTEGWNYAIASSDFDNDGDIDLVVGNIGNNNKFHPSLKKPLYIFSDDFDGNGSYDTALSKQYKDRLVPIRGKECSSEQTPYLNKKIQSYKEFALLNIEDIYGEEVIGNSKKLSVYNFSTMYYENLGGNKFKLSTLPIEAQLGPTLDLEVLDVNNDGYQDIIGVGNMYDAEAETIRYDASRGYVLLGDGLGNFKTSIGTGFFNNSDMRSVAKLNYKKENYIIVLNNNGRPNMFKLLW